MKTFVELIVALYYKGALLESGLLLLMGIAILVRKETITKFFGGLSICYALSSFLTYYSYYGRMGISEESYPRLSTYIAAISTILSYLALILPLLYARSRYASKAIVPALILQTSFSLISFVAFSVIGNTYLARNQTAYLKLSFGRSAFDALTGVVVLVFVMLAFKKNVEKEKYIPMIWIFYLIHIIYTVCMGGVFLMGVLNVFSQDTALTALVVLGVVHIPLFPIEMGYILKCAPTESEESAIGAV